MGLIQEFQQADEERRREVKQLQHEVSTMLTDLRGQAQERQAEVAAITQEASAIVEAADTFVKDLVKGSVQRRSDVATMLTDLKAQAHGRQAEVAAIAQEATAIVEAADTFVKDLAKGSAERASEVGKIRSEVANIFKDLAKGDTERRSEVAAIHEMVWGKTPTMRKTTPVVKELPREAAIEVAPAGELRDKVFTYLTNHPDGIRLTELEEEFGIARIQTARVVRELMDGNKVEKRDLLYFVI